MVVGYALKADIKHYFETLDHEVMMKIISRKISDRRTLWIIKQILDNYVSKQNGKGMPIGNLTSQFFANVYLNELDYFVKHKLKAKFYLRYVDDFIILHISRDKLHLWKNEIEKFLKTIKLELHPEKSKIIPLCKGVKFLGFKIFYNYKMPLDRNLVKIESALEEIKSKKGSQESAKEIFNGWNSYLSFGNAYKMRQSIKKFLLS